MQMSKAAPDFISTVEGIINRLRLSIAVQRADEIESLNPKVAYYCRVYAIQQVSEHSKSICTPVESIRKPKRSYQFPIRCKSHPDAEE